ncbi:Sterol 14-demethylase (Cytochrome P450 51A2) (Cytochrome P450 51G1) (AtCYP51) (Obtusifoliol 14-demethylase) (Protein EMBRYO DEFECTIVE 1738) [Durusdinium trenchii]|uniref:Sterol 14-demethylase (Cytochrome P450 51A2) (Cytochrome P450 51G1) (AtCYP51) (Obtusifoliol 14-demethylase) (Protein EMBRYO DEFECTIVE 1738) n=1 Tax=Durusdinium trenchii TaxID=1381693 RepID=A0ABP0LWH7_9DINO
MLETANDIGSRSTSETLRHPSPGMLPMSVFWPNAPIQRHRERDQARREIHEMIKPILRPGATAKGGYGLHGAYYQQRNSTYPDGRPITDEEIVGFLIAAFFGGMHNSAITTSWSTLELFSRPELVQELLEEQRAALGSDDAPFTFDAYEKMKKLRAAVSEVLRMHAPLFLLMRTVEQDVEFKGYTIRHGSVVACSPNVSQMMDDVYPKAETFDPKRFIDGIKDEFSFISFGGGRRVCKGQEFGYLQVQCAWEPQLRHYDIDCIDGVPSPTIAQDGMVIAPTQPSRVSYKRKSSVKK